jgi:hypothetical protein
MVKLGRAGLLLLAVVLASSFGCVPPAEEEELDVAVAVQNNGGTTLVLIGVVKGGLPASATVTVNGEVFAVDFITISFLETMVNAGATVTVHVSGSGASADATLVMPGEPTVTSPSSGALVSAGSPLTVTWTPSPPDPTTYEVFVDAGYTASGKDYSGVENATAEAHTIPAGTLAAGTTSVYIELSATATTRLGGGLSSRSTLTVLSSDNVLVDTDT